MTASRPPSEGFRRNPSGKMSDITVALGTIRSITGATRRSKGARNPEVIRAI